MPFIPKVSLKYLIIGVVSLSILLIAGSLIFGLFNKPKQTGSNQRIPPATSRPPLEGGGGGKGVAAER